MNLKTELHKRAIIIIMNYSSKRLRFPYHFHMSFYQNIHKMNKIIKIIIYNYKVFKLLIIRYKKVQKSSELFCKIQPSEPFPSYVIVRKWLAA